MTGRLLFAAASLPSCPLLSLQGGEMWAWSLPTPVSALLSLLLAVGMGSLALGVGGRLLDWLGVQPATEVERLVLAGGLGLGALGYGFLALGLAGLLHPVAIWAMIAVAAIGSWSQMRRWLLHWRGKRVALCPPGFFERLGAILILAMLVIVLIRGLAPVTDYDGLTYHLVVPRDYLWAGRIFPRPGEAHANFPLTVDLLYIPAILLGLESAAKLIHLGFGVLLGLGVYALARRVLGSRSGAWLALLILGTTPAIGTVGGYAHTDLGWVLFEFLAAYAVLCHGTERLATVGQAGKPVLQPTRSTRSVDGRRWLALAGVFAGLGLGSKYLGLPALGVLGVAVIVQSGLLTCREHKRVGLLRRPWGRVLGDGLLFGSVALAVAAPWYVKNWLWLGNPVYPLWFGGRGWDAYQWANLLHTGTRYGPRQGWLGFLLLPWDLFRYTIGYFGPTPFVFPTPLSWLLPLYLLVRKGGVGRPRMGHECTNPLPTCYRGGEGYFAVDLILLMSFLRFGTWAISARNARYLMDIYPLLSVAVAYVLVKLSRWRGGRILTRGAVFVLLVANLTWQALLLVQEGSVPVVLGLESREEYLAEHNHPPYRCIRFINQLPPGSRVFFVGNGQSYYVITDHVADVNHDNWGHLVYQWGEDPDLLHQTLLTQGVTHIYYSGYDFTWQLNFDFEGQLAQELALFDQFIARCARIVYDEGEGGQVYALLDQCE